MSTGEGPEAGSGQHKWLAAWHASHSRALVLLPTEPAMHKEGPAAAPLHSACSSSAACGGSLGVVCCPKSSPLNAASSLICSCVHCKEHKDASHVSVSQQACSKRGRWHRMAWRQVAPSQYVMCACGPACSAAPAGATHQSPTQMLTVLSRAILVGGNTPGPGRSPKRGAAAPAAPGAAGCGCGSVRSGSSRSAPVLLCSRVVRLKLLTIISIRGCKRLLQRLRQRLLQHVSCTHWAAQERNVLMGWVGPTYPHPHPCQPCASCRQLPVIRSDAFSTFCPSSWSGMPAPPPAAGGH